jgi:hypothetical protein
VENPRHVECGVKELWVDGELQRDAASPRSNAAPLFPAGTTHNIRVVMGSGLPS